MFRILFVCHGNICRSPMAEFIMKELVEKNRLEDEFLIDSVAVSEEEIGNDIYPPAYRCLVNHGIINPHHISRRINKDDYENNDYIILMDQSNERYMKYLFGNNLNSKVILITKYLPGVKEIEDPWYSGNYELVYNQLSNAISNFYKSTFERN